MNGCGIVREVVMKRILAATVAVMSMMSLAQAESTLTVMAPIEAQHHDPARQSAGSPLMYLVGDTLVALDYDLKTIKPLLAKS
jgi:peptide/nickel transport system substrate-binding protein